MWEFDALVRDFTGLTDVSLAESSFHQLRSSEVVKKAEKAEASSLKGQTAITNELGGEIQAIAAISLANRCGESQTGSW